MRNLIAMVVLTGVVAGGAMLGCDSKAGGSAGGGTTSESSVTDVKGTKNGTEITMAATNPPAESFPVKHTDAEWKKMLTPQEYAVLREKATDRPFVGKYDEFFQPGTYSCAACGQELFSSDTKFNSGCGWPAFYAAKAGDRVKLVHDYSYGMDRVEVVCSRCGSHLGHVFDDAPQTPTGQRFCINSTSIKFTPAKGQGEASTQPAGGPGK